tara:strand:+ start:958 stop:1410 length:453 start_codon:yes stop_codon:yes gene_type:complete
MAIIPNAQQFHTLSSTVDTTERGSALANASREVYTMQDIKDSAGPGYKIYAAIMNQSGIPEPPTATVLKNTTGATFTWTRFGAGQYRVETSSPVFTANKTVATLNVGNIDFGSTAWARNNDSFLQIETGTSSTKLDGYLNNGYLEILIYD